MARTERNKTLDIGEDIGFQKASWAVERFFWVIFVGTVLAGLLGVFGKGVLSTRQVEARSATLEYDRFVRNESPSQLYFSINDTSASGDTIDIALDSSYAKDIGIDQIHPEPESTSLEQNMLVYHFGHRALRNKPVITFTLKPQSIGTVNGTIRMGGETVTIHQFIYP